MREKTVYMLSLIHIFSTKEVVATKGRASYVGERSIGHIDPGSYSSGLLFKALLEAEE